MRSIPLGDIIVAGGRHDHDRIDLPVYSVTKHAGFVPSLEYFKKQVFSKDVSTYKRVAAGDFAYATIHLDEGSIGIAPEDCLISPMYTVFRSDTTRVDPKYLLRYLKSPDALTRYATMGRGAIHRRKSISLEALSRLPVPLPRIDDQRRIATILDQADALCDKRRERLALLDALPQAVLRQLSHDAPMTPLGNIISLRSGKFLRTQDRNPGEVPVWGANGIRAFHSTPLVVKPVVLIGRVGSAGAINTTSGPAWVTDNAMIVEDDNSLGVNYLQFLLTAANLGRYAKQSAQPLITASQVLSIHVPHPSLPKIEQFSRAVASIQIQRERLIAGEQAAETLFTSLQSRAFRGEL